MKIMNKCLIIGDSFVEGVGGTNTRGWAHKVSKFLNGYSVKLSGAGGDNVDDLIERWPNEIFNLYIIQVGTNDSRFRPSMSSHEVSESAFRDGLKKIFNLVRSGNIDAIMIFVGLFFADEAKTVPYKEDKIYNNISLKKFDELIESFCASSGASYISLDEINRDLSLLSDGIHPSPEGHSKIANIVVNNLKLKKIIQQ